MNYYLILFSSLITIALLLWVFDFGSYIKYITKGVYSKVYYFMFVLSILIIVVYRIVGVKQSIISFCITLLLFIGFLFFFNLNRKYIYSGALILLLFIPLLYFLNLLHYAEGISVLFFLLLLIGVLKDFFYDKIYY